MRVLIASKALVVGAYHDKLAALAAEPEIDELVAVVPPAWREPGGRTLRLEPPARAWLPGARRADPLQRQFHLFYWPALRRLLDESRPDVVHVDEEPYNLATVHGVWLAHRLGLPSVFFTWQNLLRRYPPPFALFEQIVFRLQRVRHRGQRRGGAGPARQGLPRAGLGHPPVRDRPDAVHAGRRARSDRDRSRSASWRG